MQVPLTHNVRSPRDSYTDTGFSSSASSIHARSDMIMATGPSILFSGAFSRGELPQTRELERALRKALGMSSREAKRLLADGMSGLEPKEKSNGLAQLRELAAKINN